MRLENDLDTETERLLITHRFFYTVIADLLKSYEAHAFGGTMVQAFCCIDYLGCSLDPYLNAQSSKNFKTFLETYFVFINDKYSTHSNEIYAIRCSFIHTYGDSKAMFNKVTPRILFM